MEVGGYSRKKCQNMEKYKNPFSSLQSNHRDKTASIGPSWLRLRPPHGLGVGKSRGEKSHCS